MPEPKPFLTEAVLRTLVDRFLAWKLPATVYPDCGRPARATDIGTNLLSGAEARAMLTHVLDGLLVSPQDDEPMPSVLTSPDTNNDGWPAMYGRLVDAEVWREWDGAPVLIAHRYMRYRRPDGSGGTYGPPWPIHAPTVCPAPPGRWTQVRFRDGTALTTDHPEQMRWGWTRPYASAADIVAWRPVV